MLQSDLFQSPGACGMNTTPFVSGRTRSFINPDQYQGSIGGGDSLNIAEARQGPCRATQFRRRLRSLLATKQLAYPA